jgi:hypothetical protein
MARHSKHPGSACRSNSRVLAGSRRKPVSAAHPHSRRQPIPHKSVTTPVTHLVAEQSLAAAGKAHYDRREIAEALSCFDKAVTAGENEYAFERWACHMLVGDYERAWQESDRAGASFGTFGPAPSSSVVIRCLHGLGDAIQFLRYAKELRAHTAEVTVLAADELLPLLDYIPGIDHAMPLESATASAVWEIECSDLPYLFRTTLSTIPFADGYITPPPRHFPEFSAKRWADAGPMRIGIVWAAGSWSPGRSLPPALIETFAEIPGVSLVSLQAGEAGRRCPPGRVLRPGKDLNIIETASLIQELDLIISVDTMVTHLAGALGKPVWTLLQYSSDWRWMLDRRDTPWYSSMRLFRQSTPGDWRGVVRDVANELRARASDRYELPR